MNMKNKLQKNWKNPKFQELDTVTKLVLIYLWTINEKQVKIEEIAISLWVSTHSIILSIDRLQDDWIIEYDYETLKVEHLDPFIFFCWN